MTALLSDETARAAADRHERVAGKRVAFTPRSLAHVQPDLWGLDLCRRGESARYPVVHHLVSGTREQMVTHADDLNRRLLGLSEEQIDECRAKSVR